MRKQNSYRVINEDIAALRNIAWSIHEKRKDQGWKVNVCYPVLTITNLLLTAKEDQDTINEIKIILATY